MGLTLNFHDMEFHLLCSIFCRYLAAFSYCVLQVYCVPFTAGLLVRHTVAGIAPLARQAL
jgi:hypothetical protein